MVRKKLRIAFVMETSTGWNANYLLWKRVFQSDRVEPLWITADDASRFDWILKVPGIPKGPAKRLRSLAVVRERVRDRSFDGLYLGSMALLPLLDRLKSKPSYAVLDATQRQLQAFGNAYNMRPNSSRVVEDGLHRIRSLAYRSCRGLFSWSNWAKDSLVKEYGVPEGHVHVVVPGVDIDQWRPDPESQSNRNKKFVKDILFVGGDFERKGGHLLLDWAKKQSRKDFHIHFVTKFVPSDDDERMTFYRGLRPGEARLEGLYRTADLFALPTLADCYSIAGNEALASGLPTILTSVGGAAEVVKDGVTGFQIPPGDCAALATSLETLLDDDALRLQMGKAARVDAEQRFDVRKSIDRTLAVICQTVSS